MLYVVVGAYPINIVSDIIFVFSHVRIHPKLYTFLTTPPADVICVIRSRRKMISSLH